MSEAKPVAIKIPVGGEKITIANGKLHVPNQPIIPFIEGDGTGRDIWRASVRVFDAAVEKARPVRAGPKVGRNDPCPCKSGKKYKHCCGKT